MKKELFKGFSVENFWLPFTATILNAHNTAMLLSKGEDKEYCKFIAFVHDLMMPLYVDRVKISLETYDKFFKIFVYVIEFVYGDPYSTAHELHNKHINVEDLFRNIKKHWNDDINKALEKVQKHNEKI